MRGLMIINGSANKLKWFDEIMESYFGGEKTTDFDVALYTDISVRCGNEDDGFIYIKGEKVPLPTFAMPLGSGDETSYPYQLKAILRMLKSRGVICINPYDAIEKTMDKIYSLQAAKEAVPEVLIPKTMLITDSTSIDEIEEYIGYPAVVKVVHGSKGNGVTLVNDRKALENLLDIMLSVPIGDQIIAQQAIMSSKGKDLRIMLKAGKYMHSFVRCNEGSFKSNLHQGGYLTEIEVPQSLIEISEKIAEAFNMELGSVDYLFGENPNEFYLCEINSSPGHAFSEDGGKMFLEAVMEILAKHGKI